MFIKELYHIITDSTLITHEKVLYSETDYTDPHSVKLYFWVWMHDVKKESAYDRFLMTFVSFFNAFKESPLFVFILSNWI